MLGPSMVPVVCRPSKIEGQVVAKAGLFVRDFRGTDQFIGGFAMSSSGDKAAEIARWEVMERVHALHALANERMDLDRCFSGRRWPDLSVTGQVPASFCLLGPHPFGPGPYLDANGLGFGPDLATAADHAVYELAERHVAAKIWYQGWPVQQVGDSFPILRNFVGTVYALADPEAPPFAMAVVCDEPGTFAAAGSCLANTWSRARSHAIEEVLLLLDGHLEGDVGPCASASDRVLSLRKSCDSELRLKHFARCIHPGLRAQPGDVEPSGDVVHVLDNVCLGMLLEEEGSILIRALSESALTLPAARRARPANIPEDWFC